MTPPPDAPHIELYGAAQLAVVQRNAAAARATLHPRTTHSSDHTHLTNPILPDITQRPPNTTTRPPWTCFTCTIPTPPRPAARQRCHEFPPEITHQTLLGFLRWVAHNERFQGANGRYRLFTAEQGLRERTAGLEDVVGMGLGEWERMGADGDAARRLRRLAEEYALAREGAWLRAL